MSEAETEMGSVPNDSHFGLPARSINGSGPLPSRLDTRNNKERERLRNSISKPRRGSVDTSIADRPSHSANGNGYPPQRDFVESDGIEQVEEESARDPRDTAVDSEGDHRFTHGPAVDFDGLSWPSRELGSC